MERSKEIEAELSGIAPALGKNGISVQPYQVPAGYFEHFAENLLPKIKAEEENPDTELNVISPLLAGLNRRTPYRVPDQYFNEFRIQKDLPVSPEARIMLIHPGNRLMRYAAAAVITGAIATAAFFSFHTTGPDPLSALTRVSDQEMANYLENHDVHWVPGTSAATPMASVNFDENDISDLLSNVSDTELEQYLPDLPGQKRTTN